MTKDLSTFVKALSNVFFSCCHHFYNILQGIFSVAIGAFWRGLTLSINMKQHLRV